MDSHLKNEAIIVYVQLLDEGTYTYRPTLAVPVGNKIYQLLPTEGYDPEDEKWEFLPGSFVKCEKQTLKIGQALVAVKLAYEGENGDRGQAAEIK